MVMNGKGDFNFNQNSLGQEEMIEKVLNSLENHNFESKKQIDTQCATPMTLYDIKWFPMGLNAIENLEDGEIMVAKRLKIRRYSADC